MTENRLEVPHKHIKVVSEHRVKENEMRKKNEFPNSMTETGFSLRLYKV